MKRIAKDFEYLLPQLTVIYYAGKLGLKVVPDSDNPVGIPVTARIPSLNLIIDVCDSNREIQIKEIVCRLNKIRYVCIPSKLPDNEVVSRIRTIFTECHVYFDSRESDDLEIIRESYSQWRLE